MVQVGFEPRHVNPNHGLSQLYWFKKNIFE